MAFLVSPGVNVSEIDATTVVPSVSTSTGAVAGAFQWGPIDVARLVSSEDELVQVFGKPDSTTALTFFTAANFLAYSSSLFVSRADAATLNSAIALNVAANAFASNVKIRNDDHYFNSFYTATNANVAVAARYPGALGNSLHFVRMQMLQHSQLGHMLHFSMLLLELHRLLLQNSSQMRMMKCISQLSTKMV